MSLFGEAVGLNDAEDLQVILVAALLHLCIMDLSHLADNFREYVASPFLLKVFLLSAWKKERVGGAGRRQFIFHPWTP